MFNLFSPIYYTLHISTICISLVTKRSTRWNTFTGTYDVVTELYSRAVGTSGASVCVRACFVQVCVYVKTDVTSAVDLDLECRLNYRYTRSRGRRMRVFSVFICLQFLHFLNRSHQHQCTETPRNKVCTPGKFSKFTMKWSKSRTPWDFPGQFKPYRKMQQKNTTFLTNSDKKNR